MVLGQGTSLPAGRRAIMAPELPKVPGQHEGPLLHLKGIGAAPLVCAKRASAVTPPSFALGRNVSPDRIPHILGGGSEALKGQRCRRNGE